MSGFRRPGAELRAAFVGCGVLLLAAWGGAWWDEATRTGWSTWVSLCRTGRPDWLTVLQMYAVLMPASVLAMLGAGLLLLLGAAATRNERLALGGLAGHASCLLAMPVAIYACAVAAGTAASTGAQFATMAAVDLVVTLALMPVVLMVLRAVARLGPGARGRNADAPRAA